MFVYVYTFVFTCVLTFLLHGNLYEEAFSKIKLNVQGGPEKSNI